MKRAALAQPGTARAYEESRCRNRVETILHVIGSAFYGGPEKQIVGHLTRLDRDRFRGILASFVSESGRSEILSIAEERGIEVRELASNGPFDPRGWRQLARLVKEERADLLCVHGYKAIVIGWWVGRKLRIPVLAFSRGYTTESLRVALYEMLERFALRRVDGVVCVSEGQRRRLESLRVRPRRVWVVHNAVDVPDSEAPSDGEERASVFREFALPEGATLAVCAGRLSPEKGQRFLVEALALLRPSGLAPHVAFCGDGASRPELERTARRLGVADRCRFVGFRRDLGRIFRAMDFLVLPSLTEGLPNVLLEAAAAAKPAVATCVGGVPEVVTDGRDGLLVPPRSPESLAAGMERLCASPELRMQLGAAARETVRARFDFATQTRTLVQIYEEIASAAGRAAGAGNRRISDGAATPIRDQGRS